MKQLATTPWNVHALFEPDVLMPSQAQRQPSRPCDPEHRLLWAVLEQAIDDLQKHRLHWNGSRPGRAYRAVNSQKRADFCSYMTAPEYVRSTDTTWLLSFENICEYLGLDAESIRTALYAKGLL